jgi:hypothetical protein
MVEKNVNKRWEEGIPHHPKSIELMNSLSEIDSNYCDNYFDWKMGGDGDNGEILMYQLDIYFESIELGEKI